MALLADLLAHLLDRRVADRIPGRVTFVSNGRPVAIAVPSSDTVVYVSSAGREVTAGQVEEWAAAQTAKGRPNLRRRSLRAAGRQTEREQVTARRLPDPSRGFKVADPARTPEPKPGYGNLDAGELRAELSERTTELLDTLDDLDRERATSASLRRQLDEALRLL